MADTSAFDLLHEGVRRQLWKMGWPELRPLQVDAIKHILTHEGHVVLSAATAAGKTEAAFLPVLSAIAEEAEGSVRAIYVGPLKALINDQFMRVEELCSHLDMPVHRWHGDVGANAKSALVAKPGGVLLITPESLESLFVNRSNKLQKLFGGLRFVVIDELHSFLDNERGLHLRSLLYRVAALTETPLRLVGLSATIGDRSVAKAYLDRDRPDDVTWIESASGQPDLKLRLHAYESVPVDEEKIPEDPPHARSMARDLVSHCRGRANLIFCNKRNDVEYFADLCQRIAVAEGLTDKILVHHGSLSADTRQETEETMKQASRDGTAATTFCSSTLEMGIDIGSVYMVGQIGAPHSVAGLKQRVGRSGRRQGASRILRMYLECRRADDTSDLFDRLHLPLIQTIAVTQLLLQGWVEPAAPSSFDLSTLTQQIISLIAETGGIPAAGAYDVLCRRGAFREIEPAIFAQLLRQLGAEDVIEQTPQGDLILGLKGEDLRKDKGFYAAFQTSDGFAVIHDSQRIGSVDDAPNVESHLILGGRRWKVVDVDHQQMVVYVVPFSGGRGAPFAGAGGVLHARIAEEMRTVLERSDAHPYLSETAARLLADARHAAGAGKVCRDALVSVDASTTAIMLWSGTRSIDTFRAMLKAKGVESRDERIAVVVNRSVTDVGRILAMLSDDPVKDEAIVEALTGPPSSKYDFLLSPMLCQETRRRRWLVPQDKIPFARDGASESP